MPLVLSARPAAAVCAAALALLLGGCGLESTPDEPADAPGDPAPARAALTAYLDGDRCDLMSETLAETLASDAAAGREVCERGRKPVDMLVEPGQYEIEDAEVIDGEGLVRIRLEDGGIRDYVLVPGGPMQYLVNEVTSTLTAEYGESLRLQARATPDGPAADAKVKVGPVERISIDDLGPDDFTSPLEHYYRVRVAIRSRGAETVTLGSQAFTLLTADGIPLGNPREEYGREADPLPSTLEPGEVNTGELLFAVPREARAEQVQLSYGSGPTGATLTWTKP